MLLLPVRAKNPPDAAPFVTWTLIALNVIVFAATSEYFLFIREDVLEVGGLSIVQMEPHRFLTSMFLHGDLFHLVFNMLFLWIFGCAVEGRLRWWKFTLLYLLAGLAGDVLHLVIASPLDPDVPMIGASGAIMGLIGAGLYIFPHAPIQIFYWIAFRIGTFDLPLWGVGSFYFFTDLFWAMVDTSGAGGGVANLAHIGGLLGGFVVALALRPRRDSREVSESKKHLAESGRDYGSLTRTELGDLVKMQPDSHELVFHWVSRSWHDWKKLNPDQMTLFRRHAGRIADESDLDRVAHFAFSVSEQPGLLPPGFLQRVASRLEKSARARQAIDLIDRVLKDPRTSPDDREAALFRSAQWRESWFQDWTGAEWCYQRILQEFPMGTLASNARTRLAAVEPRAAALRQQKNW